MIVEEEAQRRILESIHLPTHLASPHVSTETSLRWWHKAVFYQVYLRSFADANDDGVGDIAGLTGRLPYIKDLGVDAVWISPWYASPMLDGGYDVRNYFDTDPLFGSLEDVQTLIDVSHELGLRVILDFVANHCSSQHPWFQSALASAKGSTERDWFYFKDGRGEDGCEPPNDWKSIFGGPAWTQTQNPDGTPGQWYFHLFDSSQPDLNLKNENVLVQFDNILRFWFDQGVDGCRLDAVPAIGKDDDYRDMGFAADDLYRPDVWGPVPFFDAEGVHDVLRRWRRVAREYPIEKFLVGEVVVRDVDRLARYMRRDELHSTLSFDLSKIVWSADAFRQMINTLHGACFERHSWITWTLSSHDEKRTVSRYSQDDPSGVLGDVTPMGHARARAAYLLAFALPGSACIYQGEELGLWEVMDIHKDKLQDPIYLRTGRQDLGRDGCRVPLPWEKEGPSLGFSSRQETWLPQPQDWANVSVATQLNDSSSTLHFFRSVLALRSILFKEDEWTFTWEPSPTGVLVLRRGSDFRCVVNFSGEPFRIGDDEEVLTSSLPFEEERVIGVNNGAWLRARRLATNRRTGDYRVALNRRQQMEEGRGRVK
jgi:alpha-glucosidase